MANNSVDHLVDSLLGEEDTERPEGTVGGTFSRHHPLEPDPDRDVVGDESRFAVTRLEDIQDEIEQLAKEALNIVRSADRHEGERGRSYWYGHIIGAIRGPGGRGGSMVTMEDSIKALTGGGEDEDDGSWESAAKINGYK